MAPGPRDPDLRELIVFREAYEQPIRSAHAAARAELGFELAPQAFDRRLYAALELVLGEVAPGDRRIGRRISALHATDLYLATGAASGIETAVTLLRRWYGPFLDAIARDGGAPAFAADALAATGARSPLLGYLGIASLKAWLATAAAAAVPSAPPSDERGEAGPRDPDVRQVFDVVASLALATLEPAARLGVGVALVAPERMATAAALAGAVSGDHATARDRLAAATASEIERRLQALRLGGEARRSAWRDAAQAGGVSGGDAAVLSPAAVAAAFLHEAFLEPMRVACASPCPDPNLLAATLEPEALLDPAPVLGHITTCWTCFQAVLAVEPRHLPGRRSSRQAMRWALAGTVAVVAAAAALLVALDRPAAESPKPHPDAPRTLAGGTVQVPATVPTGAQLSVTLPPPAPAPETEARSRTTPVATPAPALAVATRPLPAPTRAARSPSPTARPSPLRGLTAVAHAASVPSPEAPAATATAATAPTATPEPRVTAATLPVRRVSPPPWSPALRPAPGDSRGARLVNLAVQRYHSGEESRTLDMFARALEFEPRLLEAHFDSAVLYDRLGDATRAERHWRRWLELAPEGAGAPDVRRRLER